jgi:zinc protease
VLIQDGDEPAALVGRAISDAIYGAAHPYGQPARGTRRSVASIDRDRLAAFHRVRYGPGAAFVVSVGDTSATEMERALQAVFGDWSGSTEAIPAVPGAIRPSGMSLRLVDRPGAPQSELRIGRAGPPRTTPDHARLVVLNTVLGGAFTSRLNLKLREEKGFTYGARSTFLFRRGPGPFVAGAAVATADTAEALQDALNEMDRLRQDPVPGPELERAKNYLTLSLPRRLETASAMAVKLANLHLHGLEPTELVAFVRRVREVGRQDLLDAAAEWLGPDRMSVAIVGDAAATRGPLEALRIGAVESCEVEI